MDQGYVTIRLGGQELKLRAGDDPDKIKTLAEYVDSRIREVMGGDGTVTLKVALLAAMNIAEELFNERKAHEEILYRLKEKLESLKERLEQADRPADGAGS